MGYSIFFCCKISKISILNAHNTQQVDEMFVQPLDKGLSETLLWLNKVKLQK